MANQEQLDILKQGVEVWNEWREKNPDIQIDLSGADLSGVILREANISEANLYKTNLDRADLRMANFAGANLDRATLRETNLSGATLSRAFLYGADLSRAFLSKAFLHRTHLDKTNVSEADFSNANVAWTHFADVDLRSVKGLDTVIHIGPSTIGTDTLVLSQGDIPVVFLREAGVPPSIIEAILSLIGSLKPIDFYSCFISYSSKDHDFAERLHADLLAKGVRCWLDKEDLKIGEEFRPRIDEAIRRHDKLLLVLSQQSVKSSWVETEVETAFEKERRSKKLVLFPIRLDEAVIRTRQAWAADIRRQRHIGDFTCWKDHDTYKKSFTRLLRDLKAEA
jgi:uncharacterized protein YjbI with pentapeptide repeats